MRKNIMQSKKFYWKGDTKMAIKYSFKKLFIKLIECDLSKKQLADMAGISYSSISRLANNQRIGMDSLMKICSVLNCSLEDIMDVEIDAGGNENNEEK